MKTADDSCFTKQKANLDQMKFHHLYLIDIVQLLLSPETVDYYFAQLIRLLLRQYMYCR